MNSSDTQKSLCLKDNIGWSCTRLKGHEGECTPSGANLDTQKPEAKKYHPEKVKFTCHHGVSHLGGGFCQKCLTYATGSNKKKPSKAKEQIMSREYGSGKPQPRSKGRSYGTGI